MFKPRRIDTAADWLDEDGIKLYSVSATGEAVTQAPFLERLRERKASRRVDWSSTPAFAICHAGASADYLVLAWWGNDNELFTSVSVREQNQWVEDPERYSFCLWDLEIFWAERNIFVRTMYSGAPDLAAYRRARLGDG